MASIQDDILQEFYTQLSASEGFTEAKVKKLQALFNGSKSPKANDIIKALADESAEPLP